MARTSNKEKQSVPAKTLGGRESQLVNLAVNLAEQKLRDGTASSQIITTLLNMATTKYQLENEKLRSDLDVAEAKIRSMESQESSLDMYAKAIEAFKTYSGFSGDEDQEDYYEDDGY